MRRLILAVGVLGLIASACGDDGGTATTAASTSTQATTTSTATTTSAAISTTTADPTAPRIALAMLFAGEWIGDWVNTTYGSTGPIALAIAVDSAARTATLTIDLGGSVFGAGDPAAFDLVADLSAASPFTAATPLLGEATFDVEATGAFTLEAFDVPAAGIASFRAAGTATNLGIEIEYIVGFEDGGVAEGTASLERPAG